jgi:hypothetical protein
VVKPRQVVCVGGAGYTVLTVWQSLTESQHNVVVLALPLVLFLMDFIAKTGLKVPTETAGPDLALVGIGLDISALMLVATVSVGVPAGGERDYVVLLIALLVVHLTMWLSALRCVSPSVAARWRGLPVIGSHLLGFIVIYSSLITVIQHALSAL